jgi:glycosyltransferase involved in cell wall biosynthesis
MRSEPKVSVIMPSRNCLDLLPTALSSVDAQGYEELEILVIDDGSDDGTWEWLEERRRSDPRLRPMRLSGVGPSRARNHAIERARGEYVAFLDADDLWYSGKLQSQVRYHEAHPDICMSLTNYRHVDPAGEDLGDCFSFWPAFSGLAKPNADFQLLEAALPTLFAENVVGTSTVMARRDALQTASGFDEALHSAEDWDLWLRLAAVGPVAFSGRVLCDYLMRPGSETSKAEARLSAIDEIIRRHEGAVFRLRPAAVRRARARLMVGRAEAQRAEGDPLGALAAHLRAFTLAPSLRTLRSALADGARMLVSGSN